MPSEPERRPPPVLVHPPVLVLAVLVVALGVDRLVGARLELGALEPARPFLGALFLAAGAVVMGLAVHGFRRGGTNVPTYRPALRLITGGIYRRTRNPMYLGGLVVLLGLALFLASPTLLLLTPVTALVLHHGVVKREEPYLETLFGQPYRRYRETVRRWL